MYRAAELQKYYHEKLRTPEEAAMLVKSDSRLHFGLAHGAIVDIDKAIAARIDELENLIIYSTLPLRAKPFETYTASKNKTSIRFASCHYGSLERSMSKDGRCWFVPIQFREQPKNWSENVEKIDIAFFQTGPMDRFGNFNLGPQVSDVWGVMKKADCVIIEVNRNMPYAHGYQEYVNLADVDYVVEGTNTPLLEIPSGLPSETEKKMAAHILPFIKSGSTLQLGIGGIPNAIGSLLCESDISNLSVHTEMLTDAYVDLYEAGKVSSGKKIDTGKMVYTFCGGTKRLYDFIDHNPVACSAPVNYVNGIEHIGQIENMVSINSCLQVDLYGQVNAETIGFQQISGTGGQLDFVAGGYLSDGGKSFICTPSSRRLADGSLESLIVPFFSPGTIVTTPRANVQYVVTEYGAVNLKGKSTWERAELLISIAHPDLREGLRSQAKHMGLGI